MADLKEKLVELLYNSPQLDVLGGLSYYEEAADHLIANGVAIQPLTNCQQWIPVTERLPEMYKNVLVIRTDGKIRFDAIGSLGVWYEEVWHTCNPVTHWMPLPEPPKEV